MTRVKVGTRVTACGGLERGGGGHLVVGVRSDYLELWEFRVTFRGKCSSHGVKGQNWPWTMVCI